MTRQRVVPAALIVVALISVAPEAHGAGGTPISSCGQVVTTSAFLTQNLFCSGSDGVVVAAPGITIDLKGFRLRGDRTADHHGIDNTLGFDGVTVKNGVIRNFDNAVGAYNGSDGMVVSSVLASGNAHTGINIEGNHATVKSSTAAGNGFHGIRIFGDFGKIRSSTATGNEGDGIVVLGDSPKIQASVASGNVTAGIAAGGANSAVTSSISTANETGFNINGEFVSVKSSTAIGNRSYGMLVAGSNPLIKGNRAEGNGFDSGASDLLGLGIYALSATQGGKNIARGNDATAECDPAFLC